MDSVLVKPRLDIVLVVWLSNRSGSVPGAAVSFFRQRFSSICSRYSSSCCMGRLLRSFAQSCEPLQDKKKHCMCLLYPIQPVEKNCYPVFLLQLTERCLPPLEKAPKRSRRRWTCLGDSRIRSVSMCPITSSWKAGKTPLINKIF